MSPPHDTGAPRSGASGEGSAAPAEPGERLIRLANVMMLCGLATVGLAITGAVLLAVSFVERGFVVPLVVVALFAVYAGLWFGLPLAVRSRRDP